MASKRAVRRKLQKVCKNKVRHDSFMHAEIARKKTKTLPSVVPLVSYRCGNHWHVGHKPHKVTVIQRHPRKIRSSPVDWWGEWTAQKQRFIEDADRMAFRAIQASIPDEVAVSRFVRECIAMFK